MRFKGVFTVYERFATSGVFRLPSTFTFDGGTELVGEGLL